MSHEALRTLVAAGELSATLAAHLTLLADAGVPIVVTGGASADRRDALAEAIAAASPLPASAESAEIKIAPEEAFVWLTDPAGVGCLVAGAGGAPRSPRSTRLIAHGLIERLSDETQCASIPARDLMMISGTSKDKERLVRNQPTAITESRNAAELKREAEQVLADLLPDFGYTEAASPEEQARARAAALAALREVAPTLSEYVN